MEKELKLFVWEDVLCDYTCGIAFALAPDAETARRLIREEMGICNRELDVEPDVYTTEVGFCVWGGG